MREFKVGILGVQGAIEEHVTCLAQALEEKGLVRNTVWIKSVKDVDSVDGLVIPGGESTVIGKILSSKRMSQPIKDRIYDGLPVLGTCAGLVVLAKKSYDKVVGEKDQPTLSVMDVEVERNAFGRQRESFEADLEIPVLGEEKFKGVFIRAPSIVETESNVKVLSKLSGTIVAVQEGNMVGTSFHPELADDLRLHKYFLDIVNNNLEKE